MNKVDSLIDEIKEEVYSEPLIQEYLKIKKVVDEDKELNELSFEIKKQQKLMCENINNDSIYLPSKEKYESSLKQLNDNPLMQNYLILKEEVIAYLEQIKAVLQ